MLRQVRSLRVVRLISGHSIPDYSCYQECTFTRIPIADRERLDLTLIKLAYRPSALHQKIIFPAS